jgi:hypothetical protein
MQSEENKKDDSIESMIRRMIIEEQEKIERENAKIIIQELLPEVDKIISEKIKLHFKEIAEYILSKTKEE